MKNKLNKDLLLYNFKQYKALLTVFLLGGFASFPLVTIIENINRKNRVQLPHEIYYSYAPNAMLLINLTVLSVMLVSILMMSYLNSKKAVDVYHALPVKRSELLLTQILSSYLITLIPFTFNYFLGYALNNLFKFEITNSVGKEYVFILIMLFAVLTIMMFVILNIGTTLDTLIFSGVVFVLPFLLYASVQQFLSRYIYGFETLDWNSLYYMSPLSGISLVFFMEKKVSMAMLGGYWFAVSLVMLPILTTLYDQRRSEKSEEPITNNWFFPMIISVLIPVIFLLLNSISYDYNSSQTLSEFFKVRSFFVPLIVTFVIYSLMNFMRQRSLKNFFKASINFVLITLTTILFSVLMIQTQAFGIGFKLPELKEIRAVEIDMTTLNQIHPMLNMNHSEVYNAYILRDEEAIEALYNIHSDINKTLREVGFDRDELVKHSRLTQKLDYQDYNFNTLKIDYFLVDGTKESKLIKAPVELLLNFVELQKYDDFQKAMHPLVAQENTMNGISIFNNDFSTHIRTTELDQAFYDAYAKDTQNLNAETLINTQTKAKYFIRYRFNIKGLTDSYLSSNDYDIDDYQMTQYLVIDERYPHTLAYLQSLPERKNTETIEGLLIEDDVYSSYANAFRGSVGFEWLKMGDEGTLIELNDHTYKYLATHINPEPYNKIICVDEGLCLAIGD